MFHISFWGRVLFGCIIAVSVAAKYRIAFGSCHSNEYPSSRSSSIWALLLQQELDALVLLGDNVYADTKTTVGFAPASPTSLSHQYHLLNNNVHWQALTHTLGWNNIIPTWDDHDYGLNNADSSYPHKQYSSELFTSFFHLTSPPPAGVYHSRTHTIGSLRIKYIMLDTRYFKDPASIPNRDILGEAQWIWLEDELLDASSPDIIFLGSSIQVLPTQKIVEETWSDFPSARSRLLRLIDTSPCPNIFILSGDVHHAEVSQAVCNNRKVMEFTSSGLSHSFSYVSSDTVPRRRGLLIDEFFSLYHAMYPARHREHKYADMYRGIHFGLIDVSDTSLVFRIINHEGNTVITKTVPLLHKNDTLMPHTECLPINGKETRAGKVIFTFGVMLPVFFFVVVPMVVVAWFIFAFGMYIWFIFEYKRRERLEALQHLKRD